jgi:hypothetical protein
MEQSPALGKLLFAYWELKDTNILILTKKYFFVDWENNDTKISILIKKCEL